MSSNAKCVSLMISGESSMTNGKRERATAGGGEIAMRYEMRWRQVVMKWHLGGKEEG